MRYLFLLFLVSIFAPVSLLGQSCAWIGSGQVASLEFRANRRGSRNLLILVSNWSYAGSPLGIFGKLLSSFPQKLLSSSGLTRGSIQKVKRLG
jgi:hypothetical protein